MKNFVQGRGLMRFGGFGWNTEDPIGTHGMGPHQQSAVLLPNGHSMGNVEGRGSGREGTDLGTIQLS